MLQQCLGSLLLSRVLERNTHTFFDAHTHDRFHVIVGYTDTLFDTQSAHIRARDGRRLTVAEGSFLAGPAHLVVPSHRHDRSRLWRAC